MTDKTDPKTGPGSTKDPNQANRNSRDPWPDQFADVPETAPDTPEQDNPVPDRGPGTTKDPNQADRT